MNKLKVYSCKNQKLENFYLNKLIYGESVILKKESIKPFAIWRLNIYLNAWIEVWIIQN